MTTVFKELATGSQNEREERIAYARFRRSTTEALEILHQLALLGYLPVNDRPERRRQRKRFRRETDPNYKLALTLRGRLGTALRSQDAKKTTETMDLIGCSIAYLRRHLELKFRDGMTWANHGSVWEIDHKRPCASFNLLDVEQQRACFHFTNLQPLTCEENRAKGDRWNP